MPENIKFFENIQIRLISYWQEDIQIQPFWLIHTWLPSPDQHTLPHQWCELVCWILWWYDQSPHSAGPSLPNAAWHPFNGIRPSCHPTDGAIFWPEISTNQAALTGSSILFNANSNNPIGHRFRPELADFWRSGQNRAEISGNLHLFEYFLAILHGRARGLGYLL